MKKTELIQELQAIVATDRKNWKDTAFPRAVSAAITAFNQDKPLIETDYCELSAGKGVYPAPDTMIRFLGSYWGLEQTIAAWEKDYPGATPRIHSAKRTTGMVLEFSPPPSWKHINAYGSRFEYQYVIGHVITESEAECTISEADHDLFITRSLAALMRDLIAAQVAEPVQLHRGMGSLPNSATPQVAYNTLMQAYREGVGHGN